MNIFYLGLLLLFVILGLFCFNIGQKRAYRIVLKSLLKGQINFVAQRIAWLNENRENITPGNFAKAYYSYETIGQLVAGWYRYFGGVRNDRELITLKDQIRQKLGDYLSTLELIGKERNIQVDS
jgi:hypothetical protein